jgi:hypothetical protein
VYCRLQLTTFGTVLVVYRRLPNIVSKPSVSLRSFCLPSDECNDSILQRERQWSWPLSSYQTWFIEVFIFSRRYPGTIRGNVIAYDSKWTASMHVRTKRAFPHAQQTRCFLRRESENQTFDTFHFYYFFHSPTVCKNYSLISLHGLK